MENSELFKMLNEQVSCRIDKLEVRLETSFEKFDNKLDKLFVERNILCQNHTVKLEELSSSVDVLQDRQKQSEETSKKRLTIIGFLIAVFSAAFNGLLAFFMNRGK